MCMPERSPFGDAASFIEEIQSRAKIRRQTDPSKRTISDVRPDAGYRNRATMCYAANIRTGELAVGYSGGAGGMVERGHRLGTPQALRNLDRLERLDLQNHDGSTGQMDFGQNGRSINRPYCNCAEARAVSIAVSWGDQPTDLILIAFGPPSEKEYGLSTIVNPCPNCQEWVLKACAGYVDSKHNVVCKNSRDDDGSGKGGKGGSMSFGSSSAASGAGTQVF